MHASIAGKTVLATSIHMPRAGLWTADVEADSDIPLSGEVVLELGDGVLDLHGLVASGDISQGRWRARIIGGAGGMGRMVAAKAYRGAPLRLVLTDLLGEVGERLSPTANDGVWLATVPQFWTRTYGQASRALTALCDAVGATWRALPDGTIWAGVESWPVFSQPYELLAENPRENTIEIASEAILLPGSTIDARRVSLVQHDLGKAKFRTRAWLEA
jgi:hypothetical protein